MEFSSEILEQQRKKIESMKYCAQAYEISILDRKVTVLPKVFSPATDTVLLINAIKIQSGETVLEACAGTGVISLFAAEKAKNVIATDVNLQAVKNIEENVKKYGLKNLKAVQADLFPGRKKFDVIIINPPYTDHGAQDIVEQAFWDKDHCVIKKFFKNARKHLTAKGRIYLTWANFAGFEFIENLAKLNGYFAKKISERKKDDDIIFRAYELKHQ